MNRDDMVVPAARTAEALDSGINRAERFYARWLGGIGKPAGEQRSA